MSCCDVIDDDFIDAQIEAVKAAITAYNAAILAIAVNGVQSCRLMTGQTDQMVTKASLATLRLTRAELLGELQTLSALKCGGTVTVIPGW